MSDCKTRKLSKQNNSQTTNHSLENNKKILPERKNRGLRMKFLEGRELNEENEFYNNLFKEASSDENFSIKSVEDEQIKDSFDSDFDNSNFRSSENDFDDLEGLEGLDQLDVQKNSRKKIPVSNNKIEKKLPGFGKKRKSDDEISEGNEKSSESEAKEKKPPQKKAKKILNIKNNIKMNKKKKFIDDFEEDDEDFLSKKRRLRVKMHKKFAKDNRYFKQIDENTFIISKTVLKPKEVKVIQNKGNNKENKNKNEIEDEPFNPNEKYSHLIKPTQKDLILEAIYTELYNIKSLEDMQRLEELNKRDNNGSSKKNFIDYIKVKRTLDLDQNEKHDIEKLKEAQIFLEDFNRQKEEKPISIPTKECEKPDNKDLQKPPQDTNTLPTDSTKIPNDEEIKQNKIKSLNTISQLSVEKMTLTFSEPEIFTRLFENMNKKQEIKVIPLCAVSGERAKYYDPITKQYYSNQENFKILRERYFQKEEDNLLFRIQTLSDLTSQKKERLKKLVLSNCQTSSMGDNNKNIVGLIQKYGILKNDNNDTEKKTSQNKIYSRNRENCIESGMLIQIDTKEIVISKKIFKDKHSSKGNGYDDETLIKMV